MQTIVERKEKHVRNKQASKEVPNRDQRLFISRMPQLQCHLFFKREGGAHGSYQNKHQKTFSGV